ncbi:MAG: hypothetical protein H7X77_08335, partial [Anaerolineae bacterium]|nr:hypothetical protein [Anaerolineae bacterium]
MRLSRREFLYVCGAGIGGLLTGCRSVNPEPDYTVVIGTAATFNPAALTIPAGSMVAWHNQADHIHTVTADPAKAQKPERVILPSGVAPFDSGDLFSGERWVYTFDVPGTYIYFCRY